MTRKVTSEEIAKYESLVNSFVRKSVNKNWNINDRSDPDSPLGNSGWTLADIRQYLRTEVFVALTKYNPDFRTKEGKSVKELTFIFNHLNFRVGSLLKRLTNKKAGYGVFSTQIEKVMGDYES